MSGTNEIKRGRQNKLSKEIKRLRFELSSEQRKKMRAEDLKEDLREESKNPYVNPRMKRLPKPVVRQETKKMTGPMTDGQTAWRRAKALREERLRKEKVQNQNDINLTRDDRKRRKLY